VDERERLLLAIAADPDAIENWLVYADWLSDHGDPRGELIALELAIEAAVANDEAIERHRVLVRDETAWLSPRLEAEAHHLELTLWRGFIREAEVFGPRDDLPTTETLAALFADPHACLLRTLTLRRHVDLLDGVHSDVVRELFIDPRAASELPLAEVFPSLEILDLSVLGDTFEDDAIEPQLASIVHPRLRELRGTTLALETGDFDLPNLERLVIDGDPLSLFEPRGILQAPPPRLVDLDLDIEVPDFVDALRASPLCAQLRSLEICWDPPIVDELARDPAAFSHLALKGAGWTETIEERDALRARVAALFPGADVTIDCAEGFPEPESEPPAPAIEPAALQGIGDAVMRLVDKMKARMPKP
jgi:uncharacterized protein (TIGR02996 family)